MPGRSDGERRLKLLGYRGSPLRPHGLTREPEAIVQRGDGEGVQVAAGKAPLLVQMLRPNEVARNVMVPPGATLLIAISHKGASPLTIQLGHPYADGLANLRSQLRLDELMSVIGSLDIKDALGAGDMPSLAERLPSAALMVSYALMRGNSAEARDRALDIILKILPDLPDTHIMFAEKRARAGDTGGAIVAFLGAEALGLPCFSYGLGYLADRLRMYWRAAEELSSSMANIEQLASEMSRCCAHGRKTFGTPLTASPEFAAASDYSAPLTIFLGIDPLNPSGGVVAKEQFEAARGEIT